MIVRYVDRTDIAARRRLDGRHRRRRRSGGDDRRCSSTHRPETGASTAGAGPNVDVSSVTDLAAARAAVTAGDYEAVLAIERGSSGELEFTLYTNGSSTGRTAQLLQQAATTVAIGDRLVRLGVAPSDQAGVS